MNAMEIGNMPIFAFIIVLLMTNSGFVPEKCPFSVWGSLYFMTTKAGRAMEILNPDLGGQWTQNIKNVLLPSDCILLTCSPVIIYIHLIVGQLYIQ